MLAMTTRLVRHRPARCQACRRKRVLLSLVSESAGGSGTASSPRLCRECSGVVDGVERPGIMDETLPS